MDRELKVNKCDYDFQNDTIFFYKDSDKYGFSIDIDGIILDVNENNNIMGIEILDASKKFKSSKSDLRDVHHFDATIEINEKNIEVNMKLEIFKRNRLMNRSLDALTLNNMHLPSATQGLAVTC
ncbi:MAG: DUF2283 domain-containing protein [Methanosarcinaceae archaeon]|nr:DUF2283 domain-containing protein [Methanosarcinaceae archaeon]